MPRKKLTELKSWDEIVDKIYNDVKKKKPQFKQWLKKKEKLGGYFFDSYMHYKLYNVQKVINQDDYDHFIVIAGKEGCGKSTLGIQMACMIDPKFKLSNICFKMADFLKQLEDSKPGRTFILDEGNMFLLSREAFSQDNIFMVKLFAIMRQKNLCVIICVPNFFTLDSYVRDHRVDTLVYVHKRGKYVAFVKKAIRIISNKGNRFKQVGGHKIPEGNCWPGYFNKEIPRINDVNIKTYLGLKGDHFDFFLEELQKAVRSRDEKSEFMPIALARKIIPLGNTKYTEMLASGELRGTRFGGRWFVHRKSLEEMANRQENKEEVEDGEENKKG